MGRLHISAWAYFIILLNACKNDKVSGRADTDLVVKTIQQNTTPLQNEQDLNPLLAQIGNARYVLLGEASHGTAEFYTWRTAITRRLIEEKGFSFVVVEGDWPDAYEVNWYIKGNGEAGNARSVLQHFNRWPTWMWANEEIVQLTDWLRSSNDTKPLADRVGFYGLDVYSLWESLDRVIEILQRTDPQTAQIAREAYECFAAYRQDEQVYAQATLRGSRCANQLVRLVETIRSKYPSAATEEALFNLEQNALVAVNAERYYHAIVRNDAESWNVRDQHMTETVDRLMKLHGPNAKAIIWAHNTHVGDARYTDMATAGMVNLGQLIREAHASEGVYIVGFLPG